MSEILVMGDDGMPERDRDGTLQSRVVMGTVSQMQAALTRLHDLAGFPSPFAAPQLKTLMAGLRRTLTTAPLRAKAALTWDLLEEALAVPVRGAGIGTLRADAARALHDATGATAGQLARLLWIDVQLTEGGLVVRLPPPHRGAPYVRREVGRSGERSAAGLALMRWQAASQGWPGTAVFRDATGKPLTRQGLHRILNATAPLDVPIDADVPIVQLGEVRNRAVLLVGWISALRRANLSALMWSDLTRDESGWTAYVRRSKTDQEGRGDTVSIPSAPPESGISDPAGALDDWLAVLTAALGVDPRRIAGAPVFTRVDRHGNVVCTEDGVPRSLSGSAINGIVQRAVSAAHLDERVHLTHGGRRTASGVAPFGAHSLRAGFVTDGLAHGVPESELMEQTHHKDVRTFRGYSRPARRPSLMAATAVMHGLQRGQAEQAAAVPEPRVLPRKVARWNV